MRTIRCIRCKREITEADASWDRIALTRECPFCRAAYEPNDPNLPQRPAPAAVGNIGGPRAPGQTGEFTADDVLLTSTRGYGRTRAEEAAENLNLSGPLKLHECPRRDDIITLTCPSCAWTGDVNLLSVRPTQRYVLREPKRSIGGSYLRLILNGVLFGAILGAFFHHASGKSKDQVGVTRCKGCDRVLPVVVAKDGVYLAEVQEVR
jgi:hypothetical protein